MTKDRLDRIEKTYKSLDARRLNQALRLLYPLLDELGSYELRARYDGLSQNYRYLIDYFSSGMDDANRSELLTQMYSEGYVLVDEVSWLLRERSMSGVRQDMLNRARGYIADDGDEYSRLRALFYRVWLSGEYLKEGLTQKEQYVVVNGVVLRLSERFSESDWQGLLDMLDGGELSVESESMLLVGLVLLWRYYERRMYAFPHLESRLRKMLKRKEIKRGVLRCCSMLLNTCLTGSIGDEMRDFEKDIRGQVQTNGGVRRLFLTLDEMDEDEPRLDNELEALIDKHYKKLGKLHEQGADLNYAANRAVLMSDRFFRDDIANWFLPFGFDNKSLGVDFESEKGKMLKGLILSGLATCELDKYILSRMYTHLEGQLTPDIIPSVIRDKAEFGEDDSKLSTEDAVKMTHAAVCCCFRFFENNIWDVNNLFAGIEGIVRSDVFHLCCTKSQAEDFVDHCLSLKLYKESELLCRELMEQDVRASLLQKLGYSLQRLKRYEECIEVYRRVMLIEESRWTGEHLAQVLRRSGHLEDAYTEYKRLESEYGEQKSYLENEAQCLLGLGREQDALQVFYRLSLLDGEDVNIQRGLGWCAFLCGKIDVAYKYLESVAFSDVAEPNDYLNYGHLLLTMGHRDEALDMYIRSRAAADKPSDFLRLFRKDYSILSKNGVSHEVFALMEEAVMMRVR